MSCDAEHSGIDAARRLADGCRELDGLLQALATGEDIALRVHAVRKLGKSLRGGCAVFGLEKPAGRQIQAVGRLLAASRDAVSRRQTWDRLGWNDGSPAATAIVALLDNQVAATAIAPPAEAIAWCRERVAAALAAVAALDPATLDARAEKGLKKLARAVVKRCRRMPRRGEEDFHDARKALKAHLGAGRFVHGTSGGDTPHAALAELLGDENDLATLHAWLVAHGFTRAMVPELISRIDQRREPLRARAIQLAEAIAGG